jgi:hypothetical protein
MDLGNVFGGIPPLLSAWTFWTPALAGLLLWYGVAVGVAHLGMGSGRDAVDAAVLGAWVSIFIVIVGAILWSIFLQSSVSLAVALGVFLFVIPAVLTLVLNRSSRA